YITGSTLNQRSAILARDGLPGARTSADRLPARLLVRGVRVESAPQASNRANRARHAARALPRPRRPNGGAPRPLRAPKSAALGRARARRKRGVLVPRLAI